MTPEMIQRLLQIISVEFKVSIDDLNSKKRVGEIMIAKHCFRVSLLQHFKRKEVSDLTGVDLRSLENTVIFYNSIKVTQPALFAKFQLINIMLKPIISEYKITDKQVNFSRAYIAGKITGLDTEYVEKKFAKSEAELLKIHSEVVNPYAYCLKLGLTDWTECMSFLLPKIAKCSVLYVQPDYYDSRGSLWEIAIAHNIYNIPIVLLRN